MFKLFSSEIGYVFHSDLALDILFRMNIFFPRSQHWQIYSLSQMFMVKAKSTSWLDRCTFIFKSKT